MKIKKTFWLATPIFICVFMAGGLASASWGQPYQPAFSQPSGFYNHSPYRSNYYDYFYGTSSYYGYGDILGGLVVDNLNLVSQFRYFPPAHYYRPFFSPYSLFHPW